MEQNLVPVPGTKEERTETDHIKTSTKIEMGKVK